MVTMQVVNSTLSQQKLPSRQGLQGSCLGDHLDQFSTFPKLQPFTTISHVMVTPKHKIILVATS